MKNELQDAAAAFAAAADPTRLRLLKCMQRRSARVGELARALNVPQPTISRHLRVLRRAGLVTAERQAQCVEYSLAADPEGAVRMAVLWAVSRALDNDPQTSADWERLQENEDKRASWGG